MGELLRTPEGTDPAIVQLETEKWNVYDGKGRSLFAKSRGEAITMWNAAMDVLVRGGSVDGAGQFYDAAGKIPVETSELLRERIFNSLLPHAAAASLGILDTLQMAKQIEGWMLTGVVPPGAEPTLVSVETVASFTPTPEVSPNSPAPEVKS